jgi:hypothetical protein
MRKKQGGDGWGQGRIIRRLHRSTWFTASLFGENGELHGKYQGFSVF